MDNWKGGGKSETLGAVTASSDATQVTCGAGSKGSYVAIGTTTFDYEMMLICFSGQSGDGTFLMDVSLYDGSADFILCPNLPFSTPVNALVNEAMHVIPIRVPKGSQIRCRGQANVARIIRCTVVGFSRGFMGAPGFSRMVSEGTTLVDAGGSINTKTRTQLVAATQFRYRGLMIGIDGQNDGARTNVQGLFDIEAGAAAAEEVIIPNIPWVCNTSTDGPVVPAIPPFFVDVPAGTRICANAQTNDATASDRAVNVKLWGFV